MRPTSLVPFLKWAGGKRWLSSATEPIIPHQLAFYIEPFLGSGAVFFSYLPRRAKLSDNNERLIETYQAIKDDWRAIERELGAHHRLHSRKYYYEERARMRRSRSARAAQFIYLNRTCWNGLYRVNLKGEFNVPIGTKENVVLRSDDFSAISTALQAVDLVVSDFEAVIDESRAGDFVFADPPYTANHNQNGFLKYNERIFSWDDQCRLHDALVRADKRGVMFTLMNAHHDSIQKLYRGFDRTVLHRNSILAGQSSYRLPTTELLIRNW